MLGYFNKQPRLLEGLLWVGSLQFEAYSLELAISCLNAGLDTKAPEMKTGSGSGGREEER